MFSYLLKRGRKSKFLYYISVLFFSFFILLSYNFYLNNKYHIKESSRKNILTDASIPLKASFSLDPISNIVLITMVKDENDIIYQNLVWHFTQGFRKFVIIDNNSSDGTLQLIEKFAEEVKNQASVFIIKDPIKEYIQSRIMTGGYLFARSIWPETEWFFPVDADEFWVPSINLKELLQEIPKQVDAITVNASKYFGIKGQHIENDAKKFYENLKYRQKRVLGGIGKVAFRNIDKNIYIAQGNHSIENYIPKFLSKTLKLFGAIRYESGNSIGLRMIEYSSRSSKQTTKKFMNGMQANMLAQEKKLISQENGIHWSNFSEDLEKYGKDAGNKRFEDSFIGLEDAVHDPLPIEEALKYYQQIITN